jgi:subtilisin family serine protease
VRSGRLRLGIAALAAAFSVPPAGAVAAFPADPPNDPLYDASPIPNWANEQWDLAAPGGGFDRGISVASAWPLSTGEGATVADIDLGVDLTHPDLAGRFMAGYDFYERDSDPTSDTRNSHGTQVAGILGAATDNGIGIAGVAPSARIMPLRTADHILHQGTRLAEAVVYATDHGADVLSMSLGADSFSGQLRRAVSYAGKQGVLPVVASGNEFHFHHHYPQIHDDAVAVGGINPDTADLRDKDPNLTPTGSDFTVKAAYSDFGPHLDVVAPTQVPALTFGGGTELKWSGTSAATPHVAGVATLVASRMRTQGLEPRPGELQQIIRMSADDLAAGRFAPGWDRMSGWGRVNALRAVQMAEPGKVPPVPDIEEPGWYEPMRSGRRIDVNGSLSTRSRAEWELSIGTGEQPEDLRRVASGGAAGDWSANLGKLSPGGYTLVLRATDADGNAGEDRAFFTVTDRAERLHRGFPLDLGTSGESSPQLANLDGRRGDEIVLATADGRIRVLSGRTGETLPGWPRAMRKVAGAGKAAKRIGAMRAGILATPAVGDVAGSRASEIVVTGLDGRAYAWSARGKPVRGFPYRIDLRRPAEDGRLDAAVYASPALADLAGDRKLEIVFGAADQRIYAIDGRGRDLPGWPVLAREGGDTAKILSSPAIGDLDGDGEPEIVEGTAEAYGSTPLTTGRVYAFEPDGTRVPGWPVSPPALSADSIPLAGEGVPVSPSLADVDGDGDHEVAVAAFTGTPQLYDGDGSPVPGASPQAHFQTEGRGGSSPATAPSALALGANAAFGRTTDGGPLQLFGGLVDVRLAQAQLSPASDIPFEHLVGGWDAASGSWLGKFPIPIEGWTIVTSPAIADVGGDGGAEVIAGSSGNVLHAWSADGTEPPGWPKRPGGWLLAAPAVGNVDGDRSAEVVAVTRDGYLYVWDTVAPAGAGEWPVFRHDARNTGRYSPPGIRD